MSAADALMPNPKPAPSTVGRLRAALAANPGATSREIRHLLGGSLSRREYARMWNALRAATEPTRPAGSVTCHDR